MARALLVLGLAAVMAFALAPALGLAWLALMAKPVPALCLALWAGLGPGHAGRRPLVAGLVLSALGDALLEGPGASLFLAGMSAFALAHAAYILAFAARSRELRPLAAVPFALWGVAMLAAIRPGLGALLVPVSLYAVLLTAMMWRATAASLATGAWAAALGAVLFGASDTLLAFTRFRGELPGASFLIMALYWGGQLGIAASSRSISARAPR